MFIDSNTITQSSNSSRRQFTIGGIATLATAGLGGPGAWELAHGPRPRARPRPAPPYPGRRTRATRSLTDSRSRGWGRGWPVDRWHHMRPVRVPGTNRTIHVHGVLAPIVNRCLRDTVALGYRLDEIADEGGYVCRPMVTSSGRWTSTPSNHSWGLAIDLNWQRNPMSTSRVVTDIPRRVVRLWEAWGFNWGGRWMPNGGRLADAMHFEYALTKKRATRDAARLLRG